MEFGVRTDSSTFKPLLHQSVVNPSKLGSARRLRSSSVTPSRGRLRIEWDLRVEQPELDGSWVDD